MKSINDQIRELQLVKEQIQTLQLIKEQIIEEGPQIALTAPSIAILDKAIAKCKAHAEALAEAKAKAEAKAQAEVEAEVEALYVPRLYTSFTQ